MDTKTDSTIFRYSSERTDQEVGSEVPWVEQPKSFLIEETKIENVPLDEFTKNKGYPFSVEYFDTGIIYDKFSDEEKSELKNIDLYLLEELESRDYDKTTKAAQEILKKIEKKLGITPNLNIFERLKKVGLYLKIMSKDRHIEKMKSELINAS